MSTVPDAVIITDDDGRIVTANAQAERAFGYERGELIGQPIEVLVPEQFREAHARHRARYRGQPALRSMTPSRHFVARRKDGSEIATEISLAFLEQAGGLLVISVIRDAGERMRVDERLRFQARLLDIVGQAVVSTDVLGRVTYWNRFAETIFAVPAVAAIGAYIFDILPWPAPFDQRREIAAALFAGDGWSGEFAMVRGDGAELHRLKPRRADPRRRRRSGRHHHDIERRDGAQAARGATPAGAADGEHRASRGRRSA